jgi:hypothetical protein
VTRRLASFRQRLPAREENQGVGLPDAVASQGTCDGSRFAVSEHEAAKTTYLFSISYSDYTDITQLECIDNEGAWREALATVGEAFRDIKDEFAPRRLGDIGVTCRWNTAIRAEN